MARIHPTATVSAESELHPDAIIGPHCTLTGAVKLAAGVELIGHVYLQGPISIGEGTKVYPFACLGFEPQDWKFKPGQKTAGVVVGAGTLIREHVTIHAATKEDAPTRVGDRVFMMVNSHVGHDSTVGNDVVMVNGSLLGGHTQLGNNVTLGGMAAIHQFCRIGRLAMISGLTGVSTEIPPFCLAWGRNSLAGLNIVGMRRGGISRDDITIARQAFREVFKRGIPRPEMIARLRELGTHCAPVMEMAEFVATSKRSIAPARVPRRQNTEAAGEE